MEVRRQRRQGGDNLHKARRHDRGVKRSQPHPSDAGQRIHRTQKVAQPGRIGEITSPGAGFNAGQHHLAASARDQSAHLVQHGFRRFGAHRSPRIRDGTVSTAALAAVLNLDIGAGTLKVRDGHRLKGAPLQRSDLKERTRRLHPGAPQADRRIRNRQLVPVSDDAVHAGNGSDGIRRLLCRTARDDQERLRVFGQQAPDRLPRLAVGFCRHGTGIDHVKIADLLRRTDRKAARRQRLGNRF